MAEKKARKPPRKPSKRRKEGYVERSNAVHLTVWDGYGNVLPDDVVTEIVNTVNEVSGRHGFLLSFTQT
jgi:hypothetical protein